MKGADIPRALVEKFRATVKLFGMLLIGTGYLAQSIGGSLQKVGAKLRP